MRLLALAALSRCTAFVSRAPSGARRRALASASSFAEFDAAPSRVGTQSLKWEKYSDDVLPLWVADMDFASPPCVVDALAARAAAMRSATEAQNRSLAATSATVDDLHRGVAKVNARAAHNLRRA